MTELNWTRIADGTYRAETESGPFTIVRMARGWIVVMPYRNEGFGLADSLTEAKARAFETLNRRLGRVL